MCAQFELTLRNSVHRALLHSFSATALGLHMLRSYFLLHSFSAALKYSTSTLSQPALFLSLHSFQTYTAFLPAQCSVFFFLLSPTLSFEIRCMMMRARCLLLSSTLSTLRSQHNYARFVVIVAPPSTPLTVGKRVAAERCC